MSRDALTMGLIRKIISWAAPWFFKCQWLPTYLRFLIKGHQHAWTIFTHLTRAERLLLYHLALQQSVNARILEVGSYLGASACFLAAAAWERAGKVHCVDTWHNEGMTEGLRDTWSEFQDNIAPYASVVTSHRGRSEDVAHSFKESLDLLFLDGDHSYDGCRADVLAWLPHLKPGGIIVMHDYGWAEGVKRVVAELIVPRQPGAGHVFQNTYWTRI